MAKPFSPTMVRVLFRPLLVQGMVRRDFEYDSWMILVDNEQSEAQQTVTLYHEALHLLGLTDEDQVEAMAKKLADACPEILAAVKASASQYVSQGDG